MPGALIVVIGLAGTFSATAEADESECSPPLVRVLREAIADAEAFASSVARAADAAAHAHPGAVSRRNFGVNEVQEGGHNVTFINPMALATSRLVPDGAAFV